MRHLHGKGNGEENASNQALNLTVLPRTAKPKVSAVVRAHNLAMPKEPVFAAAGSQRWLQVAVAKAPTVLERAIREAGAIDQDETLSWSSPLASTQFAEYRDEEAFRALGIAEFPVRALADFWPRRGPVWDGLAVTDREKFLLVEAKAQVAEVLSPPSKAGPKSKAVIAAALEEARMFYAPRASKVWSEHFYQYVNRLAHQYFVAHVNCLPSRLVFLDFYNAREMNGPTSAAEWLGVTKMIHAFLGLPESLERFGVFHAYINVAELESAL